MEIIYFFCVCLCVYSLLAVMVKKKRSYASIIIHHKKDKKKSYVMSTRINDKK